MPLYEYRCNDCHATFDVLRKLGERELSALCPSCESMASMPLISRVASPRSTSASASSAAVTAGPSGGGCCGGSCGCG